MKETDTHIYFWGSIYSQWFKANFTFQGIKFNCCEQFMMYNKAMIFGDKEIAEKILKTSDPKKQKELGRQVKGFNDKEWDKYKFKIICIGNLEKFKQNSQLKERLLTTGDKVIVEGSPYDRVYGVGLKWDDPKILDENNWRGENLLGKAIMETREELRKE